MEKKKLAVIRIRGLSGVKSGIKATMNMLGLYNANCCKVIENTPSTAGMIQKVKDFVTWGEISEETFSELVKKRGQEYKGRTEDSKGKIKYRFMTVGDKKLKSYFRLSPPKGGFERKGIKKSFKDGGALGYRGEKINDLLKKMI